MKRTWLIILFTLLTLILAACTPESSSQTSDQPDLSAEEPFTLDQLVATDPGTVQLAAGKVQLIEFFAYW